MIFSRSTSLMRFYGFAGRKFLQNTSNNNFPNLKRSHGTSNWYYRKVPGSPEKDEKFTEYVGAFMWWWIVWHFVTDYEELLPHYFPDPSKWTDEELGVPPI